MQKHFSGIPFWTMGLNNGGRGITTPLFNIFHCISIQSSDYYAGLAIGTHLSPTPACPVGLSSADQ